MKIITWHKSLFLFLLALTINHCRTSPALQPAADTPDPTNPSITISSPTDQTTMLTLSATTSVKPNHRWDQFIVIVRDEEGYHSPGAPETTAQNAPYTSADWVVLPTQPGQKPLVIHSIEN